MYKLSEIAENLNSGNMLNIQNCTNATRNYVHQMYGLFGPTVHIVPALINSLASNKLHQTKG